MMGRKPSRRCSLLAAAEAATALQQLLLLAARRSDWPVVGGWVYPMAGEEG
jgi:hypothetical protein